MPRKKNKSNKDIVYTPKPHDFQESGTPIPMDKVPEDVRKNFDITDQEDRLDAGEQFAGSEFIDGEGEHPLQAAEQKTPAPMQLPLPTDFSRAERVAHEVRTTTSTTEDATKVVIAKDRSVADDNGLRRFLTWTVTRIELSTARSTTTGKLTAEIAVTAMLSAAAIRQVPLTTSPDKAPTYEPALENYPLLDGPIRIKIPLWLFPEALQRRPDGITLAAANDALVNLFSTTPFEVIQPAPLPRMLAAIPEWLREELLKKNK